MGPEKIPVRSPESLHKCASVKFFIYIHRFDSIKFGLDKNCLNF